MRSTSPSASSSRSCSASTLGVIGAPRRRRPAKWVSPWASQYNKVSFHLPPIAAKAAAIGQPGIGLGRDGEGLPESAFLSMVVLRSDIRVMTIHTKITVAHKRFLVVCLSLLTLAATAASGAAATTPSTPEAAVENGQRSFDWEVGAWHSEVRVLADPLSESAEEWLTFAGTSEVRPLMDGRANVVEFKVQGSAGRIEALNLRLYEPQADRWSLTFVSMRDGLLTP